MKRSILEILDGKDSHTLMVLNDLIVSVNQSCVELSIRLFYVF